MPERAAPNSLTSGNGISALAAWRSRRRARCTNWRTAPSDSPMVRATCSRGKPSTAVFSRASRWRSGSALSWASVAWAVARRWTVSSSGSP